MVIAPLTLSAQQTRIDSLIYVVAQNARDTTQVRALNALSLEFTRTDLKAARDYCLRAIKLARLIHYDHGLSSAYTQMTSVFQNLGDPDSAAYYLDHLGILARRNPHILPVQGNYHGTAGLFYKKRGELTKALPHLISAAEIANRLGLKESYAGQLLNIGNTYNSMGELRLASQYHLKALTIFESTGNKRGQSFCFQSLANDFLELKQFNTAEKYSLLSLKAKQDLKDERGVLTSWIGLGKIMKERGQLDEARMYFDKVIKRAAEIGIPREQGIGNFQLGIVHYRLREYGTACKYYEKALEFARVMQDSVMVTDIGIQKKLAEGMAKKERQNEDMLVESLVVNRRSGNRTGEASANYNLSEYYASVGNFSAAYEKLKQYQQMKEALAGDAVLEQLREAEEKYRTEKSSREIALLKKDQQLKALALEKERATVFNITVALVSVFVISILLVNRYRVINRARQLVAIERMRNAIARDLHDDIGSTLSSIQILSQLAIREKPGKADLHLAKISESSARVMESMSDIVWYINPARDTMGDLLARMKEFAGEMLEPVNMAYHFTGDDLSINRLLDSSRRKNVFLIFKEAINNTVKYSGATSVAIDLTSDARSLKMKITDNGKGFDVENDGNGNGLRNMKARAEASGGNAAVTSSQGKGTTIAIEIPLT